MFRIKICGITTASDAVLAARAGADAIGLNFYPLSPRYIEERAAEDVCAALPAGVLKVGVFVNSPAAEIRTIAQRVALDMVQIHGDEPPPFLAELAGLTLLRAFRFQGSISPIVDYLQQCKQLGCLPAAVLIDGHAAGQYGGTGAMADWALLARERAALGGMPLVLAGGLTSGNVAAAIHAVRPSAVDTASGVEASLGKKSPQLVEAFVAHALEAFRALPAQP